MDDSSAIDVLGIGIVTVDDLIVLDAFPAPESKVPVRSRLRQGGGLAGTALVAAARLGARTRYAGTLGDDDLSEYVRENFRRERVEVEADPRHRRRPIHSTILVDAGTGSRTILFDRDPAPYEGADWPPAAMILRARVLFLDHEFVERGRRAAEIARDAGIPIVADFERDEAPGFDRLLPLVDHLIVGRAFADRLEGLADPARSSAALARRIGVVAVVTDGESGCWAATAGGVDSEPFQVSAFRVPVVDTTGCGDVFHGAYAAGLARGLDLRARLRLAAAAAALKAGKPGGQLGAPSLAEVEAFLASASTP